MTTELKPDYLPPGTVVRGYTILDRVGAGGFGALYKVTADERIYALKLSTTRFSDFTPEEQRRQEERADREVVALKSLNHPNIVRAHEFGRWPDIETGYPYILMDFVDGYRLYDWRDRTTPSLRAICIVILKIARALHEMHRVHIVHRDLKSENVLVRSDGEPVIVDFGISKPKSSYTMTAARSMLGTYTHFTPEYCAWVLAASKNKTDKFPFGPAQDLHCVGYMLYELLTGEPPFRKTDPLEDSHDGTSVPLSLLEAIRDHLPQLPSALNERIPGRIDDVCMSLLAKKPEHRPQTGEELALELERALELADESWDQPFDVPARASRAARAPLAVTRPIRPNDAPPNGISISIASVATPLPPGVVVGGAAAVPQLSVEAMPTPPARPTSLRAQASQPRSASGAAPIGGFSAPTAERSGRFIPPDAAAPIEDLHPDTPDALPSAVRKLQPRLNASSASAQRRKHLPLALGGVLVVLVGSYLALLQWTANNADPEQKPRSLLTEAQQPATATPSTPATQTRLPLVPPASLDAPAPGAAPAEVATADAVAGDEVAKRPSAPTRRPGTMNEDEQAIDRMLAEQYGRPQVPGGPAAPKAPQGPAWLKTTTAPAEAATATTLGIPLGAHIRVRLRSNLDSRTVANGPVQAMLTRPFVHAGQVLLPSRTMLYGRSTAQGGRFLIHFGTIRLPDSREVRFQGLAMDLDDGKPGLQAGRRIAGAAPKQDSVAKQVLKDTANTVLAKVGGDTPQEVARNAGDRVVNQSGTASGPGSIGDTLLLDQGVDFDIFVEEAF